MQRVAAAGRLRVSVEQSAQMIHAAGRGLTLTLIGTEPGDRDPALSGMTREAIFAAITTDETGGAPTGEDGPGRAVSRAVALKAVLPEAEVKLSAGERAVLSEWLDRFIHPVV